MNIVVCVKPVLDPGIVTVDTHRIFLDNDDLIAVVNPYDMVAVEEAVRIKEREGGHVTLLSVAPPSTKKILRRCLALGADEAMLLWDSSLNNLNSCTTGIILAKFIRSLHYDLILCGQKAIDIEDGQVGSVVAEMLGLPLASRVININVAPDGKKVSTENKLDKGTRAKIEINLPAVLTVEVDLNEPRYASLPSLIAGFRARIEEYDLSALGLSYDEVSVAMAKTRVVAISPPRPRPKKVFTPDPHLSAAERLRLIIMGGVTQKKSDILDGTADSIASTVVQFLGERKFISKI